MGVLTKNINIMYKCYVAEISERPIVSFNPSVAFKKIPGEDMQLKKFKKEFKARIASQLGHTPTKKELARAFPQGFKQIFSF